ncbi:hypothetical protein [Plantactinospora sp. GCM10030261]|uniref:hypothetical protein n=1 Tax=Plantactinospora sp. GCM10030261 TaxID=3273420 RepID=UPI00360CA6E9
MANDEVILLGGPRDGSSAAASGQGLLEIEIDGMIHRYIPTTQEREHDGRRLPVYNYDGMVAPDGGQPGVENPENRVASPLAESGEATG